MMANNNSRRQAVKGFFYANFTPSFIYPFKGLYFFATHRFLWPTLKGRLVPLTVVSTCVLAILFLVLYLPVVGFLALFHYRGSAWVNATFFILEVGSLIIQMIFEGLFVDHTQVDIFDAVLVAEGYEALVRSRRQVSDDVEGGDSLARLGPRDKGAEFSPFSIRQIVELIVLLPINFIPFAGVPLYLLLTGYRAGPLINWRYFQLKKFTRKQRQEFIKTKQRKWEYMWIGTVYMVLELVPVLALFFLLTLAAGNALWSIHLEQELEEAGRDEQIPDDDPPAYTDEP